MTRPYPTDQEILDIRGDLTEYLQDGDDLQTVAVRALPLVKIDLEDLRGFAVEWSQVFNSTTGEYLTGPDGETRNDVRIPRMIALKVVYLVFRDYAIDMGLDSQWMTVAENYKSEYETFLKTAKLDIDSDNSGSVDTAEEAQAGQVFMGR